MQNATTSDIFSDLDLLPGNSVFASPIVNTRVVRTFLEAHDNWTITQNKPLPVFHGIYVPVDHNPAAHPDIYTDPADSYLILYPLHQDILERVCTLLLLRDRVAANHVVRSNRQLFANQQHWHSIEDTLDELRCHDVRLVWPRRSVQLSLIRTASN